jgi:hypothetical protein
MKPCVQPDRVNRASTSHISAGSAQRRTGIPFTLRKLRLTYILSFLSYVIKLIRFTTGITRHNRKATLKLRNAMTKPRCRPYGRGPVRPNARILHTVPLIIGSFVAGRTGRGPVRPVAGIGQRSNYEIILFMHALNHQLLTASRAGRTGRGPVRPYTRNLESRRARGSSSCQSGYARLFRKTLDESRSALHTELSIMFSFRFKTLDS